MRYCFALILLEQLRTDYLRQLSELRHCFTTIMNDEINFSVFLLNIQKINLLIDLLFLLSFVYDSFTQICISVICMNF